LYFFNIRMECEILQCNVITTFVRGDYSKFKCIALHERESEILKWKTHGGTWRPMKSRLYIFFTDTTCKRGLVCVYERVLLPPHPVPIPPTLFPS
jgi:hypothetical protein